MGIELVMDYKGLSFMYLHWYYLLPFPAPPWVRSEFLSKRCTHADLDASRSLGR